MNSDYEVLPQIQISSVTIQLKLEPTRPNLDSSTLVTGLLCLPSILDKVHFAECYLCYLNNQPSDAATVTTSTQQRNIVPLLQNWTMIHGHLQDKPLGRAQGCATGNPQIQCRPCWRKRRVGVRQLLSHTFFGRMF